jgi:tetratricopeptide (TPR) repeat protein
MRRNRSSSKDHKPLPTGQSSRTQRRGLGAEAHGGRIVVKIYLHDRQVKVGARDLRLSPQFFELYCYLALKRLQDRDGQSGFVEVSAIKGLRGWRGNDLLSIGKQIRRHITQSAKAGLSLIEGVQKTAGPFRLAAPRRQIKLDVSLRELQNYLGTLSEREPLDDEAESRLYQFVDHISRGTIRTADGLLDEALQSYRAALAYADESYQATKAMDNVARILERQGKYEEALQTWKQALLELKRKGQQKSWAEAASDVVGGWVQLRLRNFSKAERLFDQALGAVRDTGHFQILGDAHNGLGVLANQREEHKDALSHYQQALEFWILAEYLYGIQSAYFNIGHLHYAWGKKLARTDSRLALQQYQVAGRWMEQCISLCEAAGTGYDTNDAEVTLSSVYRKTGELDKALATGETARNIAVASGNVRSLYLAYRSLLKTHLLMHNADAADALLQEAGRVLSPDRLKELKAMADKPDGP